MTDKTYVIHPFEAAGLGVAPFRYMGMVVRVGPIKSIWNGVEVETGAHGQPMGSCDYCGQGIKYCVVVADTTGKQFEVGCDCAERIGAKVIADQGLKAVRLLQQQARREKAETARAARFEAGRPAREARAAEKAAQQAERDALRLAAAERNATMLAPVLEALAGTQGGFAEDVRKDLEGGRTRFSDKMITIILDIAGKHAGRGNSKAYWTAREAAAFALTAAGIITQEA